MIGSGNSKLLDFMKIVEWGRFIMNGMKAEQSNGRDSQSLFPFYKKNRAIIIKKLPDKAGSPLTRAEIPPPITQVRLQLKIHSSFHIYVPLLMNTIHFPDLRARF
jgi:hypothetical protein